MDRNAFHVLKIKYTTRFIQLASNVQQTKLQTRKKMSVCVRSKLHTGMTIFVSNATSPNTLTQKQKFVLVVLLMKYMMLARKNVLTVPTINLFLMGPSVFLVLKTISIENSINYVRLVEMDKLLTQHNQNANAHQRLHFGMVLVALPATIQCTLTQQKDNV